MKCQVDKCEAMYIGKISFYFTCPVSDAELVSVIQEWNDGVKSFESMWTLCSQRQKTLNKPQTQAEIEC